MSDNSQGSGGGAGTGPGSGPGGGAGTGPTPTGPKPSKYVPAISAAVFASVRRSVETVRGQRLPTRVWVGAG